MTRNCPVDQIAMVRAALEGVVVDECPRCKGAWFEDQELRQAKDHADPDLRWMDFEIWKHAERFNVEPRHLRCPDDETQLVAVQYGQTPVTVDFCPTCRGIWLDKGEFARAIDALEREVVTTSAAEYLTASLAEARELLTGPESFVSEWRDLRSVLRLLRYRFLVEHQGLTKFIERIPRIG